jgi:hypothetical protein
VCACIGPRVMGVARHLGCPTFALRHDDASGARDGSRARRRVPRGGAQRRGDHRLVQGCMASVGGDEHGDPSLR